MMYTSDHCIYYKGLDSICMSHLQLGKGHYYTLRYDVPGRQWN